MLKRFEWLLIILVWLVYIAAVDGLSHYFMESPHFMFNPAGRVMSAPYVRDVTTVHPLLRWDGLNYLNIAAAGYTTDNPQYVAARAFLPLYPKLIDLLAMATGMGWGLSGLWLSRFCLLGALICAALLLRRYEFIKEQRRQVAFLLGTVLSVPMAFIFVAYYSEALFLLLTTLCFWLIQKRRFVMAFWVAVLLPLCRIQGVVFLPAFFCLALQYRPLYGFSRQQRLVPWYPFLGVSLGILLFFGFYQLVAGDPLAYFESKRLYGSQLNWSSVTGATAIDFWQRVNIPYGRVGLGFVYFWLEVPCALLMLLAGRFFWKRGYVAEAVFTWSALLMTWFSGTSWGLPRFCFALLPVLIFLSVKAAAWRGYWLGLGSLVVGSLALQFFLLSQYVLYWWPAP